MYKLLTTKYAFTITFEYLSDKESSNFYSLCRPSIFINGEFLIGLNWHNNKWHALQQILIHFCNHEWHKMFYNKKGNTNNLRDTIEILEEF